MKRRGAIIFIVVLALAGLAAPVARAGDTEASPLQLIGTFSSPVFVTSDPTNPDRVFVVEKDGTISASQNGVKSTFLDLNDQDPGTPALDLVSACAERGLLSMAFPPDYATTGYFYVLYNRSANPDPALWGDVQIDQFQTVNGSVDMSSQRHVLSIDHPSGEGPPASNCQHNGGQMQFGPDGDLYISSGDGYTYDASQDLTSLLGKILRISPTPGGGYTIPPGNPYAGAANDPPGGAADEVWSYGVRNPWRFSFDRLTGAFIEGDVGDRNWEEVNYDPAPNAGRAVNFGWSECEGLEIYNRANPGTPTGSPCALIGDTPPAYTFPHTIDNTVDPAPTTARCAITGGYVVRDQSLGALYGRYLFADLCTGQAYSAALATPAITDVRPEPITVQTPSTFGEDASGRLYIAELGGKVFRLVGTASTGGGSDPGTGTGAGTGTGTGTDTGAGTGTGTGTDTGTGTSTGGGGSDGTDEPDAWCAGKAVTQAVPDAGGHVKGTSGSDVIVGSEEDDQISGGGGSDVICAGDGDDKVKGGGGADRLNGNPGDDLLSGGGGKDRCKGGPGKDKVKSC
jgi:glucose/arabinose dehydrogenase